jgi:hypothetical protein
MAITTIASTTTTGRIDAMGEPVLKLGRDEIGLLRRFFRRCGAEALLVAPSIIGGTNLG